MVHFVSEAHLAFVIVSERVKNYVISDRLITRVCAETSEHIMERSSTIEGDGVSVLPKWPDSAEACLCFMNKQYQTDSFHFSHVIYRKHIDRLALPPNTARRRKFVNTIRGPFCRSCPSPSYAPISLKKSSLHFQSKVVDAIHS